MRSPLPPSSVLLLVLLGCPAAPTANAPVAGQPAPPSAWSEGVQAAVRADARAIREVDGAFVAFMPQVGVEGRFGTTGVEVTGEDGEALLGLSLSGWGRGDALFDVAPVEPQLGACGPDTDPMGRCIRQLEYAHDGLTEWWLGQDAGMEQGWTVTAAPPGEGPLTFVVAVDHTLGFDPAGPTLGWTDSAGHRWNVGGLAAWDARGEALPITARRRGEELVVEVDDTGATLPITVDPVYSTAAWRVGGGVTVFAYEMTDAGDLNGDGYNELAVGAPHVAAYRGAVYVFAGSASGPEEEASWVIYGASASDYVGYGMTGLGDVDGDGYDDLGLSAYGWTSGTGQAYVYLGSADGVGDTPDTTFSGTAASSYFGRTMRGGGDVNGDGYDDLVIGAYGSSTVYVYHGSSGTIDTTADTTLTGPTSGDYFGAEFALVGDVDGDGDDDLVVTAYRYGSDQGAAYLYPGSTTGLSATPSVTMLGSAADDSFGYSVVGAGDINGDGHPDVAIGSGYYSSGAGLVSIFHGSSAGLATTASSSVAGGASWGFGEGLAAVGDIQGDGYDDLAIVAGNYSTYKGMVAVHCGTSRGLDSVATTSFTGSASWDQFGASVTAGDFNGDGRTDLAVGSPSIFGTSGVYVYDGTGSGLASTASTTIPSPVIKLADPAIAGVGDLDKDGYDDLVVGYGAYSTNYGKLYVYLGGASGPPAVADQEIEGTSGAYLGERVAPAGDTNRDGYADVLVGAPSYSGSDGRVYLYRGSSTGLSTTATTTLTGGSYLEMGDALAPAGDVNADGYADVIIGAPGTSPAGKAYLYRGSSSGLGSSASATFSVSSSSDFGAALAVGDFDADGHPDLAVGDPSYSTRTGRVSIFYGSTTTIGTTVGRSLTGESTNQYFGGGLAAADVDGDGDDDLVVGAYGYASNDGKAYAYYGSSARIASTADATIASPRTGGKFGASLAAVGDVDADGYEDVVFGDSGYDSSAGAVYLYVGSATGLPSTPTQTLEGSPSDSFGTTVAAAGDVNADGFSDILVGGDYFATLYLGYDTDTDLDGSPDVDDCDDADATIYPGAREVCDGVDQDCDGVADDGVTVTLYADADSDGYGDAASSTSGCAAGAAGYTTDATDCDDSDAAISPAATEACDGVDNNCDGSVDEDGATGSSTWYEDADADGYAGATSRLACSAPAGWLATSTDCDDTRATVSPGATESCDGLDDDCDGSTDEAGATGETTWYPDADGDGGGAATGTKSACTAPSGYVASGTDCDDADATVHVGAAESCNSVDDDCDGATDEGVTTTYYLDADGDSYGNGVYTVAACAQPAGYALNATDCDDGEAAVNPGATETCDSVDNDCDSAVDEGVLTTFYADADGDGYGEASATSAACSAPAGYVALATDCDDADSTAHPGAGEVCDGADDDCDGAVDEGTLTTYYLDSDADGYGDVGHSTSACSAPAGYVLPATDCDDAASDVYPGAAEVCDDRDQDCDGTVDEGVVPVWYADTDGDGLGDAGSPTSSCTMPAGYVENTDDCDDGDAAIGAGDTVWRDADGDTYGDPAASAYACTEMPGYVLDASDCDDTDAGANPAGTEVWYDGVDQDCDGNDADQDGDGATVDVDCDDLDATAAPGHAEVWYDGVDEACDGGDDDDADGDGLPSDLHGGTDCDDADASVYPGAPDTPYDGRIQDCTHLSDNDADLDGHDDAGHGGDDCDDADAAVNPAAAEVWYDGTDQDCDGNDGDQDADGYALAYDCDDTDPAVNPGATEVAGDGVDQDCQGGDLEPDSGGERDGNACGCAANEGAASGLAGVAAALLLARRRRARG